MDAAAVLNLLAYTAQALAAVLGVWEVSDSTSSVRQWLRRRGGQIVRLGRAQERGVSGAAAILLADDIMHAHGSTMPPLTQSDTGSTEPPPLAETVEVLRHELEGMRRRQADMPVELAAEMGALEARMQANLREIEARIALDVRAAQSPTWRMRVIAVLVVAGLALRIASDLVS